jgi:aspartyl-tRNA(Asn)/glutamyl-tRNA(Gln) amidotransferase subunit A
MAPVALGSETGGSVRQPAAFCGVTGVKPTYGRVSRSGLVAFASSLDQVGPIARTVRDAALLLKAIAGADPCDATSSREPVDDYGPACEEGVAALRVALPREYFTQGLDPEVDSAVRRTAGWLEAAGARVDEVSMPHSRLAIAVYCIVAMAEASSNLARYDGVRYGRRSEVRDNLAGMYRATRGSGFGAEVRRRILIGTFVLSAGYYDAYYAKAARVRTLIRRDFLDAFEAGFDLVLTPTTPTPAFKLGEKVGDPLAMYLADVYTATVNLAGLPAISVPVALSSGGLPIGAQLIAAGFRESTLFRAAAEIERIAGRFPCPCA